MILISTNHPHLRFPCQDAIRILRYVLRKEKTELRHFGVVFTYDRFMKNINKTFLNRSYNTDVLAFELGNDGGPQAEIYINLDAARRQAQEYSVSFGEEVKRLLIHSALHMCKYRDRTGVQKRRMHDKENQYLNAIKSKNQQLQRNNGVRFSR
jgi:probable rRNA maturation factor